LRNWNWNRWNWKTVACRTKSGSGDRRARRTSKGPSVLYSKFENALEELKNKKATGPDGYQQNS